MEHKRMLMVTTAYPYGRAETFVRAELEHVARHFGQFELVPSFYQEGSEPRLVDHPLNLDYANARWGAGRGLNLFAAILAGVWNYAWFGDLLRVARGAHRWENLKELVRALYRASLFERFLAQQAAKGGNEIDLVYFYWMVPEIVGAARYRDRFRPSLKVVCRAHRGDLYEDLRNGGYSGLRKGVVHGVDAVYCISEHGKAYLEREYPALSAKYSMARLGVDDPGFESAQPAVPALSIVSCSFVVPEKRLHLLVDAIAHLLETEPALAVRWTHVGNGELFDEVRAYAGSKLGPRAEVVFTGYLAHDQVMQLYREQRFDVIVNVSSTEGIPVSLMEACAVGIPMVATDVGGNGEIVNDGNGVLLPADPDAPAIARALARFRDRAAAGACRARARADWQQKFNAAANYRRFGQSLADMASGP